MAEVVNLRRARKARDRAAAEATAAANRLAHGRTRAEKERDRLAAERLACAVDGAELTRPAGPPAPPPDRR